MPLDQAFFVSGELRELPVEMGDGTKRPVHFRELSFVQRSAFQNAKASEDEEVRAGALAKVIASSVCDPDGKPGLTYEDAKRLKPKVADSMLRNILEINGLADDESKKRLPGVAPMLNGSGTSSRSPSAGDQ